MDDKQIIEALKNEIDFLSKERDRLIEHNKQLIKLILKKYDRENIQ